MTSQKKMGRPKTANPKTTQITVRLTDEECAEFKEYAYQHRTSCSELLRNYILQVIKK